MKANELNLTITNGYVTNAAGERVEHLKDRDIRHCSASGGTYVTLFIPDAVRMLARREDGDYSPEAITKTKNRTRPIKV